MIKIPQGTGVIISIVGEHAGESLEEIFARKRGEIRKTGRAFWLYKSHSAKPDVVQNLAKANNEETLCLFIGASSRGGARPTKHQDRMKYYSYDRANWEEVPDGILVTGTDRAAFGLILKEIEPTNELIDLWDYSNFVRQNEPLKFRLGDSTLPATKNSSSNHPERMKSPIRRIIAVAKLARPYGLWLEKSPEF